MSECEVIATKVCIEGSDKTKFLCELCKISFCKRGNLNQHLRTFHQLQVIAQGNLTCALCDEKFRLMALLHEHLQTQHSITLKFVDETFYCKQDFLDWKNKIERESLSRFVSRNTSKEKNLGISNVHYMCHRSGSYKPKQKYVSRIRSMKASGSIKTGKTCPAFMRASNQTIDGITEIKVQYQSVHLGHDLEICDLRLTKSERENLAACVKVGISMDKVIDEARKNLSPTNRYRFLTRKYLSNIRRDFRIPLNSEKHQKVSVLQNADVEASDGSNKYEDSNEIEVSNLEAVQEQERNTAVSSLLLLQQNHNYSEEFNIRKRQIIDQLKVLQLRIEEWDPGCPLPEVEEHIKALNARLDICAASKGVLLVQEMQPIFTLGSPNKPTAKRRKITKKKCSKKT